MSRYDRRMVTSLARTIITHNHNVKNDVHASAFGLSLNLTELTIFASRALHNYL